MSDNDLPKFTLAHDPKRDDWSLKSDVSGRTKARFDTKAEATAGGVLSGAFGGRGGSVKIKTMDNRYQEEGPPPRGRDPQRSKG